MIAKNAVAKFEKVSFDQFTKDWNELFKQYEKYSTEYNIIDVYNLIKEPKRATSGSAGYDLFTPIDIMLLPGESITIPTGLKCNIMDGWFMAIFPRSGQGFKYGLRLANTTGIIDSDYAFSDNEGHILAKLINDSSIKKTFNVKQGNGIAQAVFMQYGLTVNDRTLKTRNGGFGSTDKE